ncbi:MAG: linear amide C-N hydrolase [Actinomycetaceae bacterium]|nr:linear amide C-N hydrolase [Actinomycetaceae bacterium]
MCTTFCYRPQAVKGAYFGRSMDIDCSFGEHLVVSPRAAKRSYKHLDNPPTTQMSLMGMASVVNETALYAEAISESGLYCAGLNFPRTAHYGKPISGAINLAPYELIPYLLTQARDLNQAREILRQVNLCDTAFMPGLPVAPMHFFLSDGGNHLIIEPQADGIHIYEDDLGVLTNNPPYPTHRANIENYLHLSTANRGGGVIEPTAYGEGLGLVGLPGDFSPMSRYVRTAILKAAAQQVPAQHSPEPVFEVLHLLHAVAMVRGSVVTAAGNYDITRYFACFGQEDLTCTFHTYDNFQPYAVRLRDHDLDSSDLVVYPLPEAGELPTPPRK